MAHVDWQRIGRATRVLAQFTLGLFLLILLPDLIRFIPGSIRAWWFEAWALAFLVSYAIARWLSATVGGVGTIGDHARRALAVVDLWADWFFQRGLVTVLGAECVWLLAAWVPHYLTWPFSRDEDTFAVLAMSWDRGILPYRDIRAYNFPGETYLFWILGKVFGWGHTVPFYAVDAACVVVLGGVMVVWSRKTLGGALPGIIGYLAFLSFYLNQAFEICGERDWHTAFLVSVGIMLLQAVPGRWPLVLSALTTAMALAIRPHAVLFVPALIAAVMERDQPSGSGWPGKLRGAWNWCLWLGLFSALAFAPLVLAGIADDLVRGLRVATYGGPYNKATRADALRIFLAQFTYWRLAVPFTVTLVLAVWPRSRFHVMARTWCLALLAALVYRPIHPVHHFYLLHPVFLVASITWAFPVACLLRTRRVARPIVVISLVIVAYEALPAYPYMCSLADSVYAVRLLALAGRRTGRHWAASSHSLDFINQCRFPLSGRTTARCWTTFDRRPARGRWWPTS